MAKKVNGEPARARRLTRLNHHTMPDFDFTSIEDFERAADEAIDFLCPKCGEWHPLVEGGCTRGPARHAPPLQRCVIAVCPPSPASTQGGTLNNLPGGLHSNRGQAISALREVAAKRVFRAE